MHQTAQTIRRQIAIALIVPLGLLVGGCGFQPLYGENGALGEGGGSANVATEMSQVAVVVAAERAQDGRGSGLVGFETRNQIIDLLGTTSGSAAKYQLSVNLRGARRGLAVQSDASVTRFNYVLRGTYKLVDSASGKTLLSGTSSAFSAYNVVDSEFATVTARRDAEFRAARNIAEDLKLQLALYFKSGQVWGVKSKKDDPGGSAPEDELPSYKKGSPRVPDDRPVGTPAPAEDDSAS